MQNLQSVASLYPSLYTQERLLLIFLQLGPIRLAQSFASPQTWWIVKDSCLET